MTDEPAEELFAGHYVFDLELVCILCGRQVGTVTSVKEHTPNALIPQGLRCRSCGGWPCFSGDVTHRWEGPYEKVEPAHRGRPKAVA